jgi:predicted  nucleic acid-binding Zn-ribbon protein
MENGTMNTKTLREEYMNTEKRIKEIEMSLKALEENWKPVLEKRYEERKYLYDNAVMIIKKIEGLKPYETISDLSYQKIRASDVKFDEENKEYFQELKRLQEEHSDLRYKWFDQYNRHSNAVYGINATDSFGRDYFCETD